MKTDIEQAAQLFAERGVARTTIAQIARASHLTERTVLSYYDSRSELNRAVMEHILDDAMGRLEERLDSREFSQKNGFDQYIDILRCILNEARENYKGINSLAEIEMLLLRGGVPESAASEAASEIISGYLEKAYRKGEKDGSISAHIEIPSGFFLSLVLSLLGMQRQLSFVMQNGTLDEISTVEKLIENYILVYKRTLSS
ncbi:MAG: TetR/AcrR family transcriptional regulator [Oscillospiraceae bacterium]|nr:TetR/AcrR family transcriptional regulator [Oscillospiraceae bacterium]